MFELLWLTLISWWFLILSDMALFLLEPGKSLVVPLRICWCFGLGERKKLFQHTPKEHENNPRDKSLLIGQNCRGHTKVFVSKFMINVQKSWSSGVNHEIFVTLIDIFLPESHLNNFKICITRLCKCKINFYNWL